MSFSLSSIVRGFADTTPNAPALSFEGEMLSFVDLNLRSSRVANALAGLGVGHGDRVAILAKNQAEFYELAFGCNKIGAISMGLNWRLAPPEITAIVADAAPKVIIVGPDQQPLLSDEARASPSRVITLGAEYDQWRDAASSTDTGFSGAPDDVALLLYTSGTTGLPKGVMLTNDGMSYTARLGSETWGMTSDSVNLVAMPMFHIGGIGYGLSTMANGGHTVLMREVDTKAIIDTIGAYGVTHSFFVPAVVQLLLNTPGVEDADFSSLELLSYGASPIGDALLRQALAVFGCNFMQVYGMTETSGTVVALQPEDHHPDGEGAKLLRSCGKALPFVDVRVIDPDTLNDVAVGSVGEIWLRSGMVTAGYWNKPDATAEAIQPGGWLRTGDAAYQDAEGYIYLFDRFKDMIVSGGENVYPAEVENVLADHPAVAEVAVIGIPHEKWGETVRAIVVKRPGHDVTETELIEFARTRVAKYKCPTSVGFSDLLPRNASGKLLKKDLRREYWENAERGIN
jgi:acyl-CoA synthetase (AMP-forming)/AMP-acid ligase II